ncbi:hypothetical protein [Microbacterium terricola]|uniref:Uncharacterized protein n=1 Tax=Microbacterium terricola TaxID=344163 RepID=A0ABM8DZY7_9MICO|nr:hypothetical protein [Microbacterium terricola]UYK41010.1 hypothetical protein OAU46_05025 [Microbacterium terricola]BDV31233.1 hypothetical protein Microterr_18930 [Microbacterium terricola]
MNVAVTVVLLVGVVALAGIGAASAVQRRRERPVGRHAAKGVESLLARSGREQVAEALGDLAAVPISVIVADPVLEARLRTALAAARPDEDDGLISQPGPGERYAGSVFSVLVSDLGDLDERLARVLGETFDPHATDWPRLDGRVRRAVEQNLISHDAADKVIDAVGLRRHLEEHGTATTRRVLDAITGVRSTWKSLGRFAAAHEGEADASPERDETPAEKAGVDETERTVESPEVAEGDEPRTDGDSPRG